MNKHRFNIKIIENQRHRCNKILLQNFDIIPYTFHNIKFFLTRKTRTANIKMQGCNVSKDELIYVININIYFE